MVSFYPKDKRIKSTSTLILNVSNKVTKAGSEGGVTKEHRSYDSEFMKQDDANPLSYPLAIVNNKTSILKDYEYYEPEISKEGSGHREIHLCGALCQTR